MVNTKKLTAGGFEVPSLDQQTDGNVRSVLALAMADYADAISAAQVRLAEVLNALSPGMSAEAVSQIMQSNPAFGRCMDVGALSTEWVYGRVANMLPSKSTSNQRALRSTAKKIAKAMSYNR